MAHVTDHDGALGLELGARYGAALAKLELFVAHGISGDELDVRRFVGTQLRLLDTAHQDIVKAFMTIATKEGEMTDEAPQQLTVAQQLIEELNDALADVADNQRKEEEYDPTHPQAATQRLLLSAGRRVTTARLRAATEALVNYTLAAPVKPMRVYLVEGDVHLAYVREAMTVCGHPSHHKKTTQFVAQANCADCLREYGRQSAGDWHDELHERPQH